jgi:hypothetical protein
VAFTKAPEYNTHQSKFIPVGGDSSFYPYVTNKGVDYNFNNMLLLKEGNRYVGVQRPPIVELTAASSAYTSIYGTASRVMKGVYYPPQNGFTSGISTSFGGIGLVSGRDLLVVGASTLVKVDPNRFSVWGETSSYGVKFADYMVGSTKYIVANERYLDETFKNNLHFYNEAWIYQSSVAVNLGNAGGLTDLVFLDGYLFACSHPNSTYAQRIYNSSIGDPTVWNASTDFLDAEQFADPIVGIAKHHNHLVAFSTNSIEFFYNAGNEVGSPLQRQVSYSIGMGSYYHEEFVVCPRVEIGNVIYFVGMRSGNCTGIYKLENFKLEKVSDDWMDVLFMRGVAFSNVQLPYPPTIKYAKFYNKEGILLCFTPTVSSYLYPMFYDINTKTWSKIDDIISMYDTATSPSNYGTVFVPGSTGVSRPAPIHVCVDNPYIPTEANSKQTIYASWKTPPLDFGNQDQKHIYSVEAVGSFGTNTVELRIEDDQLHKDAVITEQALGLKTQQNAGTHKWPLIWRNLGRFRSPRIEVAISGGSNFRLDGIIVKYNGGTR